MRKQTVGDSHRSRACVSAKRKREKERERGEGGGGGGTGRRKVQEKEGSGLLPCHVKRRARVCGVDGEKGGCPLAAAVSFEDGARAKAARTAGGKGQVESGGRRRSSRAVGRPCQNAPPGGRVPGRLSPLRKPRSSPSSVLSSAVVSRRGVPACGRETGAGGDREWGKGGGRGVQVRRRKKGTRRENRGRGVARRGAEAGGLEKNQKRARGREKGGEKVRRAVG